MSDTPTVPVTDETSQQEAPRAAALSSADLDDASPSRTDAGGRGTRKLRQGVVVSTTNDKTIIVEIQRRTTHGLYGKTVKRTARLHAHDEGNDAGVGDTVRISETRPLSKLKRWRLQDIIERAE